MKLQAQWPKYSQSSSFAQGGSNELWHRRAPSGPGASESRAESGTAASPLGASGSAGTCAAESPDGGAGSTGGLLPAHAVARQTAASGGPRTRISSKRTTTISTAFWHGLGRDARAPCLDRALATGAAREYLFGP
jgi:hypothetical protein